MPGRDGKRRNMKSRRVILRGCLALSLLTIASACSAGTLVNTDRFIEIGKQAVLEQYPDLTVDDLVQTRSGMFIICSQSQPCTALIEFEPTSGGESIRVRVAEDGRAWVGDDNQGTSIFFNPNHDSSD